MGLNVKNFISLIPPKVRSKFRNRLTKGLYSYFVLRPDTKKLNVKSISIEMTDLCNMSCTYCARSKGVGRNFGEMEIELLKKIVDQASGMPNVEKLLLGGYGEPLLYPHLIEAIEYIKSKKGGSLYTGFYTNGTLLSKEWVEKLLATKIDHVVVSLNAFSREEYLKVHRVDFYDKVVGNIVNFLDMADASDSKIRIVVQLMDFGSVGVESRGKNKEFFNFWKSRLGKNGDIVVKTFTGWLGLLDWEGRDQEQQISNSRAYPCYHLASSSFVIARNGNVFPCCGVVLPFPDSELSIGNVKDETLKAICFGEKIKELRRKNLTGEIYNINPCDKCEEYMAINVSPWIKNYFYPYIGPKWL